MKMFKILFTLYFIIFFGCSSVQRKNIGEVSKETLNDNVTELYEAAAYHVSKYYEEKGIDV